MMNKLLLTFGLAGLILLTLAAMTSHRHTHQIGEAPSLPAPAAASPPARTAPSTGPVGGVVLPFEATQIAEAARLATQFTAAYATYRYDEPPAAYLARLEPMMSTQLRPQIARTATDPTITTQRLRHHETAVAQARIETIRTLGPTSITFLAAATSQTTTDNARRNATTRYALTCIHTPSGWLVYTIDLATIGDAGDDPTTGPTP